VTARRYAGRAAWLIGLVTLLLTFSRSAGLGLLVGLGVSMIGLRPSLKQARSAVVAGGIIVGVFGLLFAPFLIGRVAVAQVTTEQFSIDERLKQTGAAWSLFVSHPLTGVGLGNFPEHNSATASMTGMWVHNVPLLIASELGLPGLAAWLIGVGAVIVAGVQSARQRPVDIWPTLMLSALIAMLVISLFDHYWWTSSQGVYVWATISGALLAQTATRSTRNGVPSIGAVSNSRAAR
jgi:O-antigen ligase